MVQNRGFAKNKILVTGANGFIGGRIVERIFLDGIGDVVAGIHSLRSAARVARFPAEIKLCDVTDSESLPEILKGVDVVIHTANVWGSKEVTEGGTLNMLEASLKAGVKLFIHFSTVAIYGYQTDTIDETSPLHGVGKYAETKINAEQMCRNYNAKGLPVVILRPSIVYGPFCEPFTIRVLNRLFSGNWKIPRGATGVCVPVYIDDVVDATFLSMINKDAWGEAFNVGGYEDVTWVEFFSRFNESLGLPSLQIESFSSNFSRTILKPSIRTAKTRVRLALGNYPDLRKKISSITPTPIKKFTKQSGGVDPSETLLYKRSLICSIAKAQKILGYEPRFNLGRGFELTASWANLQGYLPSKIEKLGY